LRQKSAALRSGIWLLMLLMHHREEERMIIISDLVCDKLDGGECP
jgi:hypothetical protein